MSLAIGYIATAAITIFVLSVALHSNIGGGLLAHASIQAVVFILIWLAIKLFSERGITTSSGFIDSARYDVQRKDESLKLSEKLFESASDGIVITNARNEIVAANPAFLRSSGYDLDEILGKNPRIFASGEHDAEFFREMWDSITERGSWHGAITDRRKDGSTHDKYLSIDAIRDSTGNIASFISIHADNTEYMETQEKMHFLAYYDTLTKLPNRLLLQDRLKQLIILSRRHNTTFAVLFLDLDRFKLVNDTMGHSVGDKLLQSVARRIQAAVRESDTVSRIGGDEFIAVLQETDNAGAKRVAQNVIDAVMQPYLIDGTQLNSQTSIGIAIYPQDGEDSEVLIKNADIAMYQAKLDGRNNYRFFSEGMDFHAANLFSMEKDMRIAIADNEFHLEYQPQLSLVTGRACGVEALIRWRHQKRGLISPEQFISIAEETGQIVQIGEWVMRTSCFTAASLLRGGFNIPVAINVSARQFAHPDFLATVKSSLENAGIPGGALEIELTEGVMLHNTDNAISIMRQLREIGVLLSIDDFGTGFSSLAYIRQMPITQLKIDKAFVSDIDCGDAAITEHVIALGHRFGLEVIAEGAETATQVCALKVMGCDKIQGYHYAKPMSFSMLMEFIENDKVSNYKQLVLHN